MAGPSMWWPTPADPSRWFSPEDITKAKHGVSRRPIAPWPSLRARRPADWRPLDGERWSTLARSLDLDDVALFVMADVDEINACAGRWQGRDGVALSEGLMRQPANVVDWVLAHELAHLRKRHRRSLVIAAASLTVIVLSALLEFGIGLGALTAALGVLVHRWLARAFERQADIEACAIVARPDMRDLRQMALSTARGLRPSTLRRVLATHPAPAERLELLSRL